MQEEFSYESINSILWGPDELCTTATGQGATIIEAIVNVFRLDPFLEIVCTLSRDADAVPSCNKAWHILG